MRLTISNAHGRDAFLVEIFEELGSEITPGVMSTSELSVGLIVVIAAYVIV
jgi:hypothetical protein